MIKCTRFFFFSNFIETIEELFVVQLFTGLQIYINFCDELCWFRTTSILFQTYMLGLSDILEVVAVDSESCIAVALVRHHHEVETGSN